jgi:putative endonuclease
MNSNYWVCVLANVRGRRPVLYIGVTNDLARRITEHRLDPRGFVERYKLTTLVYFECMLDVRDAIRREKTVKGWCRYRKVALIRATNPEWRDLLPFGKRTVLESGDPSASPQDDSM